MCTVDGAAIPVAVALIMWAITGTLNGPELALALTGLLNAVAVYEVPNAPEGRP